MEALKVLYVDDEALNLKVFEIAMRKHCNLELAESGLDAIRKIQNDSSITHLITDLKMPGMDGLELVAQVQKDFPIVKRYVLSGFHLTEEISEALNSRLIDDYFEKPIKPKYILETIKKS